MGLAGTQDLAVLQDDTEAATVESGRFDGSEARDHEWGRLLSQPLDRAPAVEAAVGGDGAAALVARAQGDDVGQTRNIDGCGSVSVGSVAKLALQARAPACHLAALAQGAAVVRAGGDLGRVCDAGNGHGVHWRLLGDPSVAELAVSVVGAPAPHLAFAIDVDLLGLLIGLFRSRTVSSLAPRRWNAIMGKHGLASLLSTFVLICHVAPALASQPDDDDESIGTRPAADVTKAVAPKAMPPPAATPMATAEGGADDFEQPKRKRRRKGDLSIAADPPTDWAVLHAGFRPHLGTFGGIATFALAHERTERFYGLFSLSAIRNDAGTHVGGLQLAIGRNLADNFIGLAQFGIAENRARSFIGVGQLSLAYNRALDLYGVHQLAAYNRAKNFRGLL